ncbi:MAG: TetR/AcrR family transcriptional regulator [Candidatus Izemoplasmatales bacterium]
MPKDTFFKITETKRKFLVDVGSKIFASKDFEEIEIKEIVEAAMIPRGSFYAYFYDLEDYYSYVISKLQEQRVEETEALAKSFNGDFFKFIIMMYENDIRNLANPSRLLLQHHYFRYIQAIKKGSLMGTIYNLNKRKNVMSILIKIPINSEAKNKISLEEKEFIADLCMTIYLSTYNQAIQENLSSDEHLNLFKKRIRIIEKGVKSC